MITIYKITCLVNKKIYIGQTKNKIEKRLNYHKWSARRQKMSCPKLEKAINYYGADNFVIEQLANTETREEADLLEEEYISKYDSIKLGYNIQSGGTGGNRVIVGSKNPNAKLTDQQVNEIRILLDNKSIKQKDIADKYDVHTTTIQRISYNVGWHENDIKPTRRKQRSIKKWTTLTEEKVKEIKTLLKEEKMDIIDIANLYGVCYASISHIKNERTWKHVK